ncbi:MAG: phytoene desaturase family protein [Bacteroidales bacterium]
MKHTQVLIVGAGLGGLATALRLAKKGYNVRIVEKNSKAGGRLNQIQKDGFTFDMGPSFFSMSYEFEEFARDCNISLPFSYVALDPLYSVHFRDNDSAFHMYKDIEKFAAQFKDIEPDFAEKFERYITKAQSIFDDTVDVVIKQNVDSLAHYMRNLMTVNPRQLLMIYRDFYSHVSRYFTSLEAREIISLVAFFLGRTPFDTMAIYSLLSYTEFKHDGYYNVKGGMYSIVTGLLKELEKEGVECVYNTEIVDYAATDDSLDYLIDSDGKKWQADRYVINGDAAVFRGRVFNRKKYSQRKLDKMNWTLGYVTMYVGISTKLPDVNHHNYFIGTNFKDYAKQLTIQPDEFEKPYYYVNVLSKHNEEAAPEGCESLFFVCPVPTLLDKPDWSDKDVIAQSILDDFSERIGIDISSKIVTKTVYTPEDWGEMLNLHRGSGLGLSHTIGQIGALRPSNVDEQFSNVAYVGASTVPGAGLPMAVISSKLAVERIENMKKNC